MVLRDPDVQLNAVQIMLARLFKGVKRVLRLEPTAVADDLQRVRSLEGLHGVRDFSLRNLN